MAISKVIYKTSAQDSGTVWMDSTSATASAADITAPKTAMLADGVVTTGTGSGGGSGGLEYETGTYTPASDIARPTISFAKTHSVPPASVIFSDVSGNTGISTYSNLFVTISDFYRLNGTGIPYNDAQSRNGTAHFGYFGSSLTAAAANTLITYDSDTQTDESNVYYRYWATASNFMPFTSNTSRKWKAGRTYKWIAIWGPTT